MNIHDHNKPGILEQKAFGWCERKAHYLQQLFATGSSFFAQCSSVCVCDFRTSEKIKPDSASNTN